MYITIINNTSVMLALYYLLAFYHATYTNTMLKQGRPLPKFISVKLIIFFAFWQVPIAQCAKCTICRVTQT